MGCIRPELTKPRAFAKGGESRVNEAGKQFVKQPPKVASKTARFR